MKIGIITNGAYKSDAYNNQIERIVYEIKSMGDQPVVWENNRPYGENTDFGFTKAIFLDKDTIFARFLEKKGIILQNSARDIEIADDKGNTYISLLNTVKQQQTVIRPKRYFYSIDQEYLREVGKMLGYPLVAKLSRGSLGQQVYLVNDFEELKRIDKQMGIQDGIYQKYRESSKGKSYRIICIGGKFVGGIKLASDGDFRSNHASGGNGEKCEIPPDFIQACELVAKTLNLGYCGVDVFCDKPVIIEVNSNAFFEEFEKITEINVAKQLVDFIINK